MEHLKITKKNPAKQGWGFSVLAWDSLSGTFWPGDTGHQTVCGTSRGAEGTPHSGATAGSAEQNSQRMGVGTPSTGSHGWPPVVHPSTYECLLYACPVHWGLDAPGSSLESDSNCFGNLQQMFSFLGRMLPHFPYVLHETSPDFPPPSRGSDFAINSLPGWQVCRLGSWRS